MLHPTHIDEKDSNGTVTKFAAILVVLAALCALGAYVVYGSGMWNPPVHHADY